MKKPFIILAVIFVLYAALVLYMARLMWKHNLKFLSVIMIAAAAVLGYIFYPILQPLFF